MICALVAPEHQGSDLLLRTNCVSWILIILFAWHGFVIYPSLEAAEGGKKPGGDCSKLHLPKQTELPWIHCTVAEMQQWYIPSIHFHRFRERWKKWYLPSNSGTLTGVHMWKITSRFQSCEVYWNHSVAFIQAANMLSEAPRTSDRCKSVSAHLPPYHPPTSSGILFNFCWHGRIAC